MKEEKLLSFSLQKNRVKVFKLIKQQAVLSKNSWLFIFGIRNLRLAGLFVCLIIDSVSVNAQSFAAPIPGAPN